jgi:UDP-GlcNAc:undecaprenyl-phosphate GlcNAc-1-phosphate transferase
MILQFFTPIFEVLVFTLIMVPISIKISDHFGLIDEPFSAPHKTHKKTVPKAGGMAIFTSIVLAILLSGNFLVPEIKSIILAATIIFIFGIWDDAKGLSAGWKMTGQILAVSVLIWQGIHIRMFASSFLNMAITCIWIVGVTNAFNLVDSMDSLVVGLAAVASVFFLLVTIDSGEFDLAYLSAVILGSCIGMFYFNATPARTFMGDSGAQLLGFILATLAMAYTPPGFPQPSSWFVPILLLIVPIFDTTFVVVSRMRRRVPIYKAGRDHVYHRLTRLGMSPVQSVTIMHVFALLTGCLAFIALTLPPFWANTLFALILLSGAFILAWLEQNSSAEELIHL